MGPRRVIEGDIDHLEQVMVAILSHAIESTPEHGSIAVKVSSHAAVVEITITDTATGMSAERVANIFEPFAWIHQAGGVRSGLARARHIVEAHGGTLTAYSDSEGTGSTFTLQLPFVTGWRREPSMKVDAFARSKQACPDRLAGVVALVLADQPDSRELIETLLARCHVRVVAVESVRKALDALNHHSIDVIITDVGLREEDGLTLMKLVRTRPPDKGGRLPAIAISSRVDPTARERALEAGYQTVIAKPVDPPEVLAAVCALVSPA
jgi:CheY-like chemotaxis protein